MRRSRTSTHCRRLHPSRLRQHHSGLRGSCPQPRQHAPSCAKARAGSFLRVQNAASPSRTANADRRKAAVVERHTACRRFARSGHTSCGSSRNPSPKSSRCGERRASPPRSDRPLTMEPRDRPVHRDRIVERPPLIFAQALEVLQQWRLTHSLSECTAIASSVLLRLSPKVRANSRARVDFRRHYRRQSTAHDPPIWRTWMQVSAPASKGMHRSHEGPRRQAADPLCCRCSAVK